MSRPARRSPEAKGGAYYCDGHWQRIPTCLRKGYGGRGGVNIVLIIVFMIQYYCFRVGAFTPQFSFSMTTTLSENSEGSTLEMIRESLSAVGLSVDDSYIQLIIDRFAGITDVEQQTVLDSLRGLSAVYVEDNLEYALSSIVGLTIATGKKVTVIVPTRQSTLDGITQQILTEAPGVVFLDYDLPEGGFRGSGIDIAKKLQAARPDLLLIGASSNLSAFEKLGIIGFDKPIDSERILDIATGIAAIQQRTQKTVENINAE